MKKRVWKEEGFTLIELMVVIVIIGLLATFIAPRLFGRVEEAKIAEAKIQMRSFENALELFKIDNGFYPSTEQGLEALVVRPTTGRVPQKWREGGYLDKGRVPLDPWGNRYIFLSPGINAPDYEIKSLGPDGSEGGDGENADIANYNLQK